jgi:hypothetical protein
VSFDLIVEKETFISGMETLEEAVSSFLHVCFVANMHCPVESGILCTWIQRFVAKLDEHGTAAGRQKKDQTAKEDKAARSLKKVFDDYKEKMFIILSNQ